MVGERIGHDEKVLKLLSDKKIQISQSIMALDGICFRVFFVMIFFLVDKTLKVQYAVWKFARKLWKILSFGFPCPKVLLFCC